MLRFILAAYCEQGLGLSGAPSNQSIILLGHLSCPLQIPNPKIQGHPLPTGPNLVSWETELLTLGKQSPGKLIVQSERPSAHTFEEHEVRQPLEVWVASLLLVQGHKVKEGAVYHFDFSCSKSCFLQVISFRGGKKIEKAEKKKM